MSSVWVIDYNPTKETLPLIFKTKMSAFLELKVLCDLYNMEEAIPKELKDKKILAYILFSNLNILKANIDDFNVKEVKKLTAAKRLKLYEKLQQMTIDAANTEIKKDQDSNDR